MGARSDEPAVAMDPWVINDRIKAAAIRWFGSERAAAGFGAFLVAELGLTQEWATRYCTEGQGLATVPWPSRAEAQRQFEKYYSEFTGHEVATRWVSGWERAE